MWRLARYTGEALPWIEKGELVCDEVGNRHQNVVFKYEVERGGH